MLFFNAVEGYRVSHPVPGGDASLTLAINESQLRELAPRTLLRDGARLALTLVQCALGPRTAHTAGASVGTQRLVDRVKLVLSSDLARRWFSVPAIPATSGR